MLEATFVNTKTNTLLDEKEKIDICCRTLYKCNAYKRSELNPTTEWHIPHCECVSSFQVCLKNLNTSLSNEVSLLYSINATKCYSHDHPTTKCIQFGIYYTYSENIKDQLLKLNIAEREKFFNRCTKYALDESRRKQLQILDVKFDDYAMSTINGNKLYFYILF